MTIPLWLHNRSGLAAGGLLAAVLAYSLWSAFGAPDPDLWALISNAGTLVCAFFGLVTSGQVARDRRLDPQLRRAWTWLSLGIIAYLLGELTYLFLQQILRLPVDDYPATVSDIFYLLFYPLAVVGLARLPAAPLDKSERLQFWLDLLIVLTAAWMVVWHLIIHPAASLGASALEQTVLAAYPVGDLVALGGVVALLFRRLDAAARSALVLYTAGLAFFVATDLAYAYLKIDDLYATGGALDAGWMAALLLFGLAALRQRQTGAAPDAAEAGPLPAALIERLSFFLPFLAIAVGYGLLLLVISGQGGQDLRLGVELAAGALLTGLVIFRQTVALRENRRLNARLKEQYALLEIERDKSERLLLNILPGPIADRLKQTNATIADNFAEVTVLFADIVGFTPLAAQFSPEQTVGLLNQLFTAFDKLAERYGLEKIKTIGDAYMAVSGLPTANPRHAEAAAAMALEMHRVVARFGQRYNAPLQIRIGLNSGPVVAGVIGQKKFIYDLWGDTVNTASRMESHGTPGLTHLTQATYEAVRELFVCEARGVQPIKGKGDLPTYFLLRRR